MSEARETTVSELHKKISAELGALRIEKRNCHRWSSSWYAIDGQQKALQWVLSQLKGIRLITG